VSAILEIAPFRLDAATGVVTRDGNPAPLGPRAVAVLKALLERPNEYISKRALIDAVWPDVVVEEANLAVQIGAIRRVLGNDRIETLARRGYRFVGDVTVLPEDRQETRRDVASNLPAALTSFVGRERELAEIKRLLPRSGLLTLVGAGGIGKTRLALEVAAEVIDAFRDGVWFVDLAPLTASSQVTSAAAQVLGARESTEKPPIDVLCAYLKRRQLLLMLDNCEHVLPACADLATQLLQQAPAVTIVATSREPLCIDGEQSFTVQPLALPVDASEFESTRRSEAVRLFVERVKRQLPDFELTAERATAVAGICVHLDGIPLALELAAARARSLSVEQIGARLDQRFRLLTGGSSAALPRHRTLRATLDWSYDLLAEDERKALRRLAVFPASFTAEAASAVVGDEHIDEFAVIDLLSQLVARSLVFADTRLAGARYRLLETTRVYALEKLIEAEEIETIKRRHAEYFGQRFDRLPDDRLRMSDRQWHDTYLADLDNARAALDWIAESGGDPALGIRLAGGSAPLWSESGLFTEGLTRLQTALASIGPGTRALDQARLWYWLNNFKAHVPMQALEAARRAVDASRLAGDAAWLGLSLMTAGASSMYLGRTRDAAALLAEAAPLVDTAGLPKLRAEYLLFISTLKWFTGDFAGARVDLEMSAGLCQQSGCTRVERSVIANLAEIAWTMGDLDTALVRCREAVQLAREASKRRRGDLGMYLTNLAGIHVERGEFDAALRAAREGLPLRQEFGSALWPLDHLALRVALAGRMADAARIAGHADYGYAISHAADRQPNEARARERLHALLRESLPRGALERLLGEGAKMAEDDACRLALED
jgi:predicted ATPase/DNA-binding winged helix-turn-helix (wHTH) protein